MCLAKYFEGVPFISLDKFKVWVLWEASHHRESKNFLRWLPFSGSFYPVVFNKTRFFWVSSSKVAVEKEDLNENTPGKWDWNLNKNSIENISKEGLVHKENFELVMIPSIVRSSQCNDLYLNLSKQRARKGKWVMADSFDLRSITSSCLISLALIC